MVIAKDLLEKYLDYEVVPAGTNDLTSKSSFYQEKIYHYISFKEIENKLNSYPIDYNYYFYNLGKVDEMEQIIIVDNNNLKQSINYSNKLIYNLNFVIDAFDDFLNLMNRARAQNLINKKSTFFSFKDVTGFIDPQELYKEHLFIQFDIFMKYLDSDRRRENIFTFKQFISEFVKFIDFQVSITPISFSSFITSKFSDPRTTGLIFDIFPDDKSEDRNKFLKYLKDPCYPIFFNAATEVGFSIDKDVPWRLIANIDSLKMKNYMSKYNTNRENVFQSNYKKVNLIDFNLFKENMIKLYNLFVKYESYTVEKKVKKQKNKFIVKQNIKYKQEYKENEDIWLRLYTYIRARENNLNWDQATFDTLVEEAEKIKSSLDMERSLRHIERAVNLQIISKKVNRNFYF